MDVCKQVEIKCTYIKLSSCVLRLQINIHWQFQECGHHAKVCDTQIDSVTNLGGLTFSDHVDYVCKRIAQRLGLMQRFAEFLCIYTRKIMYNTMIRTYFYYFETVFCV